MKYIILGCLLVGCLIAQGQANAASPCGDETIYIDTVELKQLLPIVDAIRKCIKSTGAATAYVSGDGGELNDALAFFDIMRTEGLSKHTTFIATGTIISASNLVWLAAEKRIALPGSSFLIHGPTLNMHEEDERVRTQDARHVKEDTTAAVLLAAGSAGAKLWSDVYHKKDEGILLTGEEIVKYSWATEIRKYPPSTK